MARRVAVTGMGAVTPLGNDVTSFWEALKRGECGIDQITRFSTENYRVHLAGEVKNFGITHLPNPKQIKRSARFSQYAAAAAYEAVLQSGIVLEEEDPYRMGVSIGVGFGGIEEFEEGSQVVYGKQTDRVRPLLLPSLIPNMASANTAILLGLKGKCINIATACATGNQSIGEAYRSIQHGEADIMLAGGSESILAPTGFAGFASLQALSFEKDKTRASIPFDRNRSGFVMGEGAGVLVLEELEHAKKRGAVILAELAGYGTTCDAYHITAPMPDGESAARAMKAALDDAEIRYTDVDYINAHGTGTPMNDRIETIAIKKVFQEHSQKLYVNSTKSAIGHLIGGAGGVEAVVCVKSILDQYIHQTVGSCEAEEDMDLQYCFGSGIHTDVRTVLSNAFGFGGHNASLVFRKYPLLS